MWLCNIFIIIYPASEFYWDDWELLILNTWSGIWEYQELEQEQGWDSQ